MIDREKVIRALENCTDTQKCKDCPWETCEAFDGVDVEVPRDLVMAALELLKAQEEKVVNLTTKIAELTTLQEPVVRCRECRYWRQEVSPTEHWVCAHHSFNERKMYTTPVFYCADGERR